MQFIYIGISCNILENNVTRTGSTFFSFFFNYVWERNVVSHWLWPCAIIRRSYLWRSISIFLYDNIHSYILLRFRESLKEKLQWNICLLSTFLFFGVRRFESYIIVGILASKNVYCVSWRFSWSIFVHTHNGVLTLKFNIWITICAKHIS